MTRRSWLIVCVACGLGLLVPELYALWSGTTTLSQVVWQLDAQWPLLKWIIALAVVVLWLHWFLPLKGEK